MAKITSFTPIFQLIRDNKRASFYLLLASFTINCLALSIPITLLQIYDRIIVNKSFGTLSWMVSGCIIALVMEFIVKIARGYLGALLASRFSYRGNLYTLYKILNTKLEYFEAEQTIQHMHKITSIETLKKLYGGEIFQTMLDIPFASIYIGVIWYLMPNIAIALLFLIAIYLITITIIKLLFESMRREQTEVDHQRYNFLLEVLRRIPLIKALTIEERVLRGFENVQDSYIETAHKSVKWKSLPPIMGIMLTQTALFGVVVVGAHSVIRGEMTVGILTACMLLSSRATAPIQMIGNTWLRLSEAKFAYARLQNVEMAPKDVVISNYPIHRKVEGYLKIRHLSYRYRRNLPYIFENFSADFPNNKITGISSGDGSGSSTLMLMLIGALKPSYGSVYIDDFDISKVSPNSLRGIIEYVSETSYLFKGTILENICMFDQRKFRLGLDTANMLEINSMVSSLPKGFETEIDSNGKGILPSGLPEKILIGRALVNRPKILLLDNLDKGMDHIAVKNYIRLIKNLKKISSCIVVSKNYRVLKEAETIYEIENKQLSLLKGDSIWT